ncbi:MAG: FecR domain-containing protein [Planctomycetota bacterium]
MERDPADLIEAYFSGELEEAGAAELRTWLRKDPQRFEQVASQSLLEAALNHVYQSRQLQDVFETAEVLDELHDSQGLDLNEPSIPQIQWSYHNGSRQHNKTLGVIAYVGRHVFQRYVVQIATAAAVLVVGVILVFVLRGIGDNPVEPEVVIDAPPVVIDEPAVDPEADEPEKALALPAPPAPPAPMVVATLTAERDAAWDRQPGQELYAGERFTLTQGFAEVTTKRGALALLQAPASIELLDNENALYLHTGKLVGICETEPSKGFLIRTRHLEITDLGTRFGVDASVPGVTRVQVFEGEVAAVSTNANASVTPTRLTAGSSSQVKSASGLVEPIAYNDEPFASLLERVAEMVDGYSLSGDIERVSRLPESGFGIDQAESDRAQLYRVASEVMSDEAVRLHLGKPGMFVSPPTGASSTSRSVLPAGTRFDLYLVHFDPPGNKETLVKQSRVDFEITFDRSIYGVFADTPFPAETSVSLDRYQNDLIDAEGPGLLTFGDNDRLELSNNRHILKGTLKAMICDRFWVLVTHEPGGRTD